MFEAQIDPFLQMAERIRVLNPGEFGGAVVIVPPDGGSVISFLLTDSTPKPAQYWSGVQSRVEIGAKEAEAKEREQVQGGMYGMRR